LAQIFQTQLAIKRLLKFPFRQSISALLGEIETSKILHFHSMQYDDLIK